MAESLPSLKVNFPSRSLKDKFKSACALNGKNMNEIVIQFIRQHVSQHESRSTNEDKETP